MFVCTFDSFARVFGFGWAAGIVTAVLFLCLAAWIEGKNRK